MDLFFLRVKALLWKEVLQAIRDPRLRFLIILPPLLQLVAFGYAANLDLKNIPIALYDEDRSSVSRELAFAFASSGYFRIVKVVENNSEITELIDRGTIKAALHFGPDLASRIKSRRTALVQVIVAGTNSNTASLVQSYSLQIFERFNRSRLKQIMNDNPRMKTILPAGPDGIVRPEIRIWYNTNLVSKNFYVPGIISLVIMVSVLNLTAMAVVREKEMGTMEQIMVTPIRPLEFILGKTLPFAAIGIFQVALVGSAGVFWFGVPMRGSVLLLFLCLLIYLLSILSLGLFISTISRNQQQALVTTFFFTFPIILLSGFIFPISNMPTPVQVVTYANPLRYFLIIIRDIFLKGSGIEILWPQMAALLGVGLALMALAVTRISKTLD
ncbi:MAG: ABC transporter permease [Deltaproteobacteria bacterium CG_4_8_14_3_um_filter_51_11]|nr:ABC transporter permease [bacterium]OIP39359.1 MAG: ABC transporter permease [Desulfobacteraceae bacterium CG2_30_51_40]PIP46212.1 MAG: ABC transporter permease [Deltaproteobacteria bacterium CG23_combo_of_CG06-09_8_20_14_all_51_20]PIX19075.1 MAG: ABC transporter permease [Deltaproteobacteria bacterium CG_4_8_14_3_um_filter_51_11]PIY22424.1 MAG: ABC transporter permease [Deltaproteobacteria bacterium CG_4_10_14_3_um_filter_51_14]PJB37789.1 MAG: ABC transporter permease [Deltaproteobacteria 